MDGVGISVKSSEDFVMLNSCHELDSWVYGDSLHK